ncbi:MAG: hypothetical protein K2X66_19205, partial [Cyanobacteria bacterium]|nr:hypothetical protein [Cyanobacteriota bacterium]
MTFSIYLNPHLKPLRVNGDALSVGRQGANASPQIMFSARLDPKADPKDQIQSVTKENKNNKVEGLSPPVRVLTVLSLFLGGVFGFVGPAVNKFQVDRINQAMVQEKELIQKKGQDLKQLAWLGKQVNVEPEARIIFNASQKQYREDLTAIQEELGKVRKTYKDSLNEYIAFNLFVVPVGEASLAIGVVMASLIGMRIRRLGKRKGVLILKQPDKGRGYEEQVKYYKNHIPLNCAALSRLRLKAIQQDPDLASLMKSFYSPDELRSEKAHAQKLQSLYEALVYL